MARDATDLADMKRLDQGNHEIEVLAEGAEGVMEWEKCMKNPGHEGFIPAPEFSIDHLPEKYRDEQFYQYIRCMMDLTVKVKVMCVSADRPDGYPFSKFRGKTIPHIGSGCVTFPGFFCDGKVLNKTCPCNSCKKSANPEEMWWECNVITAKHVVFNTEEARTTIIEVYHDSKSRDSVKYLYGVSMIEDDTDGDRCEFRCVTHDAKVAEQLKYSEEIRQNLSSDRTHSTMFYPSLGKEEANLCVVISHPHGCSKHVTIGNWKECLKQEDDFEDEGRRYSPWYETCFAFTYDTPTCPGSSGGCTLIMGSWDPSWKNVLAENNIWHTHSSGQIVNGQNVNTSCYWLLSVR